MRLKRRIAAAGLAAGLVPAFAGAALEFRLEAGRIEAGAVTVERLTVRGGDRRRIDVRGLAHPAVGRIGSITVSCANAAAACSSGTMTFRPVRGQVAESEFALDADALELSSGDASARLARAGDGGVRLVVDAVPLHPFMWLAPDEADIAALSGALHADMSWSEQGLDGSARLSDGAFDTGQGRYAAGGLGIVFDVSAGRDGSFGVSARWRDGEMLLGPVYLPPPDPGIDIDVRGRLGAGRLDVSDLSIRAGERLRVAAGARLDIGDGTIDVRRLEVDSAEAELAWLWRQGLESVAASRGWGGLSPSGSIRSNLAWSDGGLDAVELDFSGIDIDDEAHRIGLSSLAGSLRWERADDELDVSLDWTGGTLYRLPLGQGALRLAAGPDGDLRLLEPARIPILDGAFVIERLLWRDWNEAGRELRFDAGLEPIGLDGLTRALGWNEFGGSLSGRFDGLRLSGGVAEVRGGLEISLFDGRAEIRGLSVERPFGSSPALAADIELSGLDLELFTRAFEAGRMEGRASGYLRELRLLDWQPVQFDAWFETDDDSPERVITQRAVETLSSLSGGGGAAISGLLLRWFDEFPYRKAGLGCRLSGNVCLMRGLSETEQGGYVILEGRGIPRLDIVGHQRRVDWPSLMQQLQAL